MSMGNGNPYGSVASAYRQSRVMSASRADLIVMLYERLLADLRGAAIAIHAGDIETKSRKLQRALDVIFELLGSLDRDQGGEVSQRLAALYSYMISRVGEASRNLDTDAIDEVAGHVESLLQAWATIASNPPMDASLTPPPGS